MDIKSLIEKIAFFSSFTQDEKKQLLNTDNCFAIFKTDEYIIHEKAVDNSLFIILQGTASVFKDSNSLHVLAILKPGAVMGEISFLTHQSRTTNVTANEDTICFRINNKAMETLDIHLQSKIKDLLIKILVQRLDQMNQTLLDTVSAIEGVVFSFSCEH